METLSPPPPGIDLSKRFYYQVVFTLTDLLPPPLDASPAALSARNQAAIAKVAALLPVNANEIDLAAQCIAARAQADDVLRLLRLHAGNIGLVMRLNAQYASMLRTSLSVHGRLMRVQALRQKREAIEGAANQDAWTQHIAERSMLKVIDPDVVTQQAAPAAAVDPLCEEKISSNGMNSHPAAFETDLTTSFLSRALARGADSRPQDPEQEATAEPHLVTPELPANIREGHGRADQGVHINGARYGQMSRSGALNQSPQQA